MDHRDHYARAQRNLLDLVASLTDDQLAISTPCEGWTVADLLGHIIEVADGFTIAFTGADVESSTTDPRERYREAAASALSSVADDAVLDSLSTFGGSTRPGWVRISFGFADTLVHTWDIARSTGNAAVIDPELVNAALAVVAVIPDEARGPGRPFAAIVPVPDDAGELDRLLATSGRSPAWSA